MKLDQQRLDHMMVEPLRDKTVAVVEVAAIDVDAARSLAFRELRLVVDMVNFFVDLKGTNARIAVRGEVDAVREYMPVILPGDTPRFHISGRWVGALQPVEFPWLIHSGGGHFGFYTARNYIENPGRGDLADVLLSAIQWAGRAAVDARPEEAFLLYAIALESLLLGPGKAMEPTYRLRLRVAHLLGSDEVSRKELVGVVGELYDVRSKIVHAGKYQVTDDDLGLIRYLTTQSISRILIFQPFALMKKHAELEEWFEKQLLVGSADAVHL